MGKNTHRWAGEWHGPFIWDRREMKRQYKGKEK